MKERVLITGASGFIGYHLIEEALNNNLEVHAAVRKNSNIDHLKKFNIQFTYPDFNNLSSLKRELLENRYDYIIHAAGVTKARLQREYNLINSKYVHNLAQAVIESGIDLKKFVLMSSLAALGPLESLKGVISENSYANPITRYGVSKLLGEERLKAFTSLNYTILRPTGVYGPRDKDIFIYFKQLVNGIEPYMGKAEQKLSFLYVTDLAKVTIKALYSGFQKTYNLSDGNFYDRYELSNLTKEYLNIKTIKIILPVNLVKFIARISEKYAAPRNKAIVLSVDKLNELLGVNWSCDIERVTAELGFYPEYNLKAGVAATLQWYKLNKWL